MHTSNESNQKDKTELQQMGKLCGNFLTVMGLLQKNIKIRKPVMDGFCYPPAAVVSNFTMADPSKEDHTIDLPKASIAEPLSLVSHPLTMASPEFDKLLKQFHNAKRARVENITQGMSGLPKARLPREGGRSDGGTRDGGEIFQACKRKRSHPQSHSHRCGGGTCMVKGEEFRMLREQLWAMQSFLEELQQQQGFLQVYQPGSSQAQDQEKGETSSPECDNCKRDMESPEGSDCKPHTHQDNEHEGRFSKVKMDGWQIPQDDDRHLMLNKGHKNLLETLKQELSHAEGLTPNHLKKAKLLFFYCRYPNSNVLKTLFPDIKFNRCITSQLIKWFSNFREFYYIQIEKFSRQLIVDGVNRPSDLSVTRDSELFRALNMHFNKASDFQVPNRFLEVAEITLREFFNAISLAKDLDPSWKKAIYKVICILDSDVPEVFKSSICW
ncbi:hypothetical protein SKAU_G00191640 [Synaphobranchus kaupii]|uniref:Prospero domain-containing protein n=1 Tax=Synaphobranchus kaupii TaxID=118154 RepID=A0A9Q1FDJ1_SYNKA|nr:hypothetical protein SKAU_G00191640 [Synaphobranchus kaupii]